MKKEWTQRNTIQRGQVGCSNGYNSSYLEPSVFIRYGLVGGVERQRIGCGLVDFSRRSL